MITWSTASELSRRIAEEIYFLRDVRQYREFVAEQRLSTPGLGKQYRVKNPLAFMDLQDVQELANFCERRVAAYPFAITGEVAFDAAF